MKPGLFVLGVLLLSAVPATAQFLGTGVLESGVSRPTLVKAVKATYTPEAKTAQLQGWVDLEAVVWPDGKVGDVKVVRSCVGRIGAHREPNGDPFRCARGTGNAVAADKASGIDATVGLNQQAVKAAEQWVFRPGMRDGKAVAVRILIRMNFDLRDKPSSN